MVQGVINTAVACSSHPAVQYRQLSICQPRLVEEKGDGVRRQKKSTLEAFRISKLSPNVGYVFPSSLARLAPSFFSCFYLSRALLESAKELPWPPELCVAHQVQPSERTLMCYFPSTFCPKWICTSAIIFCHYSFRARHCEDVQTILAALRKKQKKKKKRRREREA